MASTARIRKEKLSSRPGQSRLGKERVLIEFPTGLLERADAAAAQLEKNRSELIRMAVEKLLDGIEKEKFEAELAAAYVANSARNLDLLAEFAPLEVGHSDRCR